MNEQDLVVPDTSNDNVETGAADVQQEESTQTDQIEGELEIPLVPTEEMVPVIEDRDPLIPESEPPPSVQETARQVFSENSPRPLAINLYLIPTAKQGSLQPKATVEIDPSLRTSGLLAALPAEEAKTLLALLTFLTPNGDIKPTVFEVAQGLHISEAKAKERLSCLHRFRWQARPLVSTLHRETGMDGYTLTREVVSYREGTPTPRNSKSEPAYRAAGRDAIIAHSRANYARPRAEVERQIAMMQGWPLPEEVGTTGSVSAPQDLATSPVEYLRQRLFRMGVTAEQVQILLETFPIEEIEQQIAWLPYRGAKNPASYLVAAITGRYAEPGLLQMRREQQESAPPARPDDPPWLANTP